MSSNYLESLSIVTTELQTFDIFTFTFKLNERITEEIIEDVTTVDYKSFSHLLADILLFFEPSSINLTSSSGIWNDQLWGDKHAHITDGTTLNIAHNTNKISQLLSNWYSIRDQLSNLLGGSFSSEEIRVFPITSSSLHKNNSIYSIKSLLEYFPNENCKPSSINQLLKLLPYQKKKGVAILLENEILNSASWRSFALKTFLNPLKSSKNDNFVSYITSLEAKISLILNKKQIKKKRTFISNLENLLNSDSIHIDNATIDYLRTNYISKNQENKSFDITHKSKSLLKIDRTVIDSRDMDFSVYTEIKNNFNSSLSKTFHKINLSIIEVISPHYSILLDTYKYKLFNPIDGTGEIQLTYEGYVSDLPSFTQSNEFCNFSKNQNKDLKCSLTVFWTWDDLPSNSFLVTEYKGLKILRTRDSLPPDPNRGVIIPPSLISANYLNLSSIDEAGATDIYYTDAHLLTSPIPDPSMPFNVITLVNTFAAFFIGSLANALVKALS